VGMSGPAAVALVKSILMNDAMGNRFSVSGDADRNRQKRLREGPVKVCYGSDTCCLISIPACADAHARAVNAYAVTAAGTVPPNLS
jgi:hypothetical protein